MSWVKVGVVIAVKVIKAVAIKISEIRNAAGKTDFWFPVDYLG